MRVSAKTDADLWTSSTSGRGDVPLVQLADGAGVAGMCRPISLTWHVLRRQPGDLGDINLRALPR